MSCLHQCGLVLPHCTVPHDAVHNHAPVVICEWKFSSLVTILMMQLIATSSALNDVDMALIAGVWSKVACIVVLVLNATFVVVARIHHNG